MFRIARDDEGFALAWDGSDSSAARDVKMELTLEGLGRGREWTTGLTVLPYRNAYETLSLLIGVLRRLGVNFNVSEDLSADQAAADAERHLLDDIRNGRLPVVDVASNLEKIVTARSLLAYQRHAVQKHLALRNGAKFSVPGAGKTMVGVAYWIIAQVASSRTLASGSLARLVVSAPGRKSTSRVSETPQMQFGFAARRMNVLSSWKPFRGTNSFSAATTPLGGKNGQFVAHWTAGRGCWSWMRPITSSR